MNQSPQDSIASPEASNLRPIGYEFYAIPPRYTIIEGMSTDKWDDITELSYINLNADNNNDDWEVTLEETSHKYRDEKDSNR